LRKSRVAFSSEADTGSREENASKQEIGARFCRIRAERAPRLLRQRLSWRPAAFTVGRHPGHFRENPNRLNDKTRKSRAHDL
jgi:hypothetical protein